MKEYFYYPKGVCSREMHITYEGNVIKDLNVIGGCNGNLKGISALVKGRTFEEVISAIEGTKCGPKNTSCPDQIAKALKEIQSLETK